MTDSPRHRYLDSCAVVSWLCSVVPDCEPIDVKLGGVVQTLLDDTSSTLGLSELTLVEVHDTLAKLLRSSEQTSFDVVWFESAMDRLMDALAAGNFTVVRPPPKVVEHAMALVTVASRDSGARVKAWDATHIVTAAGWTRELGQRVEVVTADSDFKRLMDLQPHFGSLLDLQLVSV